MHAANLQNTTMFSFLWQTGNIQKNFLLYCVLPKQKLERADPQLKSFPSGRRKLRQTVKAQESKLLPGIQVFRLPVRTIVIILSFLVDLSNHIKTSRITVLSIRESLEQIQCHSSALFSYPVLKKRNCNSLHEREGYIKGNAALQNMNITPLKYCKSIRSCN